MLAPEEKVDAGFRSLTDLRAAHAYLMRAVRKDGAADNEIRVAEFLKRAQATGTEIESQNERDAAQGILDYWAAWQFSSSRQGSASATPPTLADFVPTARLQHKPAENPFVGLRAFEEKDADAGYFIGREEATRSLLDKVQRHPIVFVRGALGSGKSSLVFAGCVPRLRSRSVIETRKEPLFPAVIPGPDPIAALLRAVLQVAIVKPPDENAWLMNQQKRLKRTPGALAEIIREVAPGGTVILIVDQFEEIFTLCSDLAAREQFVQAIAGFVEPDGNPNRAILIIREDYAQQVLAIPALQRFARDADAQFTPPQLTVAELARAITSAAEAVDLEFEDGLVEELAQDAAGDAATLPTLQFTLSRLWAALPSDSNRITRELCRQVGKPRVALARAADGAFESLSKEDKEIARRQFLELVQPTSGDDVRRRRAPLDTLAQLTGDDPNRIEAVLSCFEQAELVRRTKGSVPGEDRFEVAHEALVSSWQRLDEWVKDKRRASEKKLQLVTAAQRWRESGQRPDYLLAGQAIKDAIPYVQQTPEIRDLVAASEARARAYLRRQLIIGTALVLLMAVLLTVYVLTFLEGRDSRSTLRTQYAEKDQASQDLDVQTQYANDLANSLRAAQDTIARQKSEIERLRQELRLPSPPPPPPNKPSTPEAPAAGQRGWMWIGSDVSPNLRDPKTGSDIVPSSVTTDNRYDVTRNVVLRSEKPTTDTYAQAQSLGLVLNGAQVKALGPAVGYDRPSGTRQYWLPVQVDPSDKPIVYYQYAGISKAEAQTVADAIQSKGYRIPEIQTYDKAKATNEVRYFFPADRAAAVRLAADVTQILKQRRLNLPATKVVDPSGPSLENNFPGVLELWLDPSPR
jgi:hypothetical protein